MNKIKDALITAQNVIECTKCDLHTKITLLFSLVGKPFLNMWHRFLVFIHQWIKKYQKGQTVDFNYALGVSFSSYQHICYLTNICYGI